MYLKALEIQGFKSFPDKTVLNFGEDITAIVGPNGSGKSNISDAIRWVMGEQSAKGLRGAKMEDVIFGGTEKRAPVGFAQVTLVLDNTGHIFPTMEESEVAVTRRYYRSGESEYYINRQSVRLKDVTELFLDTGMGKEGYSIIGQGKIDEILSAKSGERREIFEEAAGISKFRHRKEDAERKLERTEENLVRINDKISELELQVEPLQDQAERAKKYLLLRDEMRVLEISVWLENLDELKADARKLESDFRAAEAARDEARAQLDAGWQEYQAGVQQLADSRAEYETQKADAQQKLDEGLQQLTDAEEQVSKIKKGEWYVLDRNSTLSFVTFEQYADRMDAIARVFPVFFFLVAALVATTTMTRMVDENRLQMGTLKALGYSNASIAGKYLFYALTASVLGSMAGMVVGFLVFPSIIWYAYQLIFSLPTFTLRFYPGMAAASMAISAAVIGLATWSACRSSLKEKSAALLLPRAPVAGKRIFLEYITPLWKRMSFSQKTTARNLFRYKKRFFMTVLGVAGCTALLLIGFGLQDSLLPIVTKQSTELSHNDLTVTLSDPAAFTVEKGLTDALEGGQVENWAAVYSKSVTIYNADGESAGVSVVGAQTDSQLSRYVTFRTRQGHKAIPFEKDSVVLTEKTALNLGVEPGDSIWVENPDGERVEMTLTGVTENYMFTRLYVSNAQLQTLLDTQDIPWNTVYAQTRCDSAADRNTMRETLLACNYVTGASFTEDATSMFDNLIVSLNSVVVLIIVCAAALAAVVLYNLISVNLAERKKELATIKVLGFYDKEVYRYIFREIDLLALMGSCVGLLLGIPLHQFIIRTVEMDQLMFIRTIAPHSYLLSVALTMIFTLAVCFVMRRHVKKISMVESMKAPE